MMLFVDSGICLGGQYSRPPVGFQLAEPEGEREGLAQPRILVVDDERILADTTAAILSRAGFVSRAVYDGFDALATMASFRPDYLLTDVMMPAMNGIELAMTIAKIYPATKIVLFSGQAGISQILEDSKAQGFEFPLLAKPVHPSKLIEGLKMLGSD
jgi:CheY-like chemotaxis protein